MRINGWRKRFQLPKIPKKKARADWQLFEGQNYPYDVCRRVVVVLYFHQAEVFEEVYEAVSRLRPDRLAALWLTTLPLVRSKFRLFS